jgi:hypothetical protein
VPDGRIAVLIDRRWQITVPLSGDTFEAEIADESGVLMLYQPSRAKARAFYPLASVLKIGWRIVSASPEEQAVLDAHGFGSRRSSEEWCRMVGACRPGAHGAGGPAAARVWTLHKGDHAAAIDLKAVPGIGAEIVLTVDG